MDRTPRWGRGIPGSNHCFGMMESSSRDTAVLWQRFPWCSGYHVRTLDGPETFGPADLSHSPYSPAPTSQLPPVTLSAATAARGTRVSRTFWNTIVLYLEPATHTSYCSWQPLQTYSTLPFLIISRPPPRHNPPE